MRVFQTIFYLELTEREQFIPAAAPAIRVSLRQVKIPCPAYNRFFYEVIGADWHWVDRKQWQPADWERYVMRSELETWVAYSGGNPVGYYEIEKQADQVVELVQLGVMPQFTRRGIGGYLLNCAVRHAWRWGAKRIWLHTCSHDDPAALSLYKKHGFRIYKQEIVTKEFPDAA